MKTSREKFATLLAKIDKAKRQRRKRARKMGYKICVYCGNTLCQCNQPSGSGGTIPKPEAATASCSRPASEYGMRHAKPAKDAGAREWIQLTPRFENGNFAGYNQTNGTHFYDNVGQQYSFVPLASYEKLEAERNKLARSLDGYVKEDGSGLVQSLQTRVKELEAYIFESKKENA